MRDLFTVSKVYLGLCALALLYIIIMVTTSPADSGFSGIFLVLLTIPWSFLILPANLFFGIELGTAGNMFLLTGCALINYLLIKILETPKTISKSSGKDGVAGKGPELGWGVILIVISLYSGIFHAYGGVRALQIAGMANIHMLLTIVTALLLIVGAIGIALQRRWSIYLLFGSIALELLLKIYGGFTSNPPLALSAITRQTAFTFAWAALWWLYLKKRMTIFR